MRVFGRFSRIQRTLQVLPNVGLLGGKMGANCLFIPFFCILSQPNPPYILPLSVLSPFVFILSTRAHNISFCLGVLFFSLYAPIYFNPVSLFSHRSWLKFCMCLWSFCSSLHPPNCLRETRKPTARSEAMRALVQIPAFVVMAWTHK